MIEIKPESARSRMIDQNHRSNTDLRSEKRI